MNKQLERMRVVAEVLTAPAVAVLFWAIVFLIVLMTFARGSFWEANFFEAFGAIGQVGFAGAVFWLGWQQFKFTKQMAGRQHNLESFSLRRAALEKIDKHAESLNDGTKNFNDGFHYEAIRLMVELGQLFSARISDAFYTYTEVLEEIIRAKDRYLTITGKAERAKIADEISDMISDAYGILVDVMTDMEEEMSIVD